MITVLLSLWDGWRPVYTVSHARTVARMVRQHIGVDVRVALLTERLNAGESEFDAVLPLPELPVSLPIKVANCYRRLRYFDPWFQEQFDTPWLLSLDLDTLLVKDFRPQIDWAMAQGQGFAIQRALDPLPGSRPYCGCMHLLERGKHAHVWESLFKPEAAQRIADSGWVGSDQVWLSLELPGMPTFGPEHGSVHYARGWTELPSVVHYGHGMKPWSPKNRLLHYWQRFSDAGNDGHHQSAEGHEVRLQP